MAPGSQRSSGRADPALTRAVLNVEPRVDGGTDAALSFFAVTSYRELAARCRRTYDGPVVDESVTRRQRLAWASLCAFAVTLGLSAMARGDIYVYTDAQGVLHFSNQRVAGSTLYVRSQPNKNKVRPGVTPVAPSDKSLERFTRFEHAINEAATLYQLPRELVRAVIKVESDYDPRAVSSAGAQGLMQLMPETALRMQVRDSFDPRLNILAGTRYLRILANTFNGDLQLTIAAYNAGEGAVARHGGIPPYQETQVYVTKVLHFYHRYRSVKDVTTASLAD